MKLKDFRSRKVVIGTYVPSDLFEMPSHYSERGRANRKLDSLVEELSKNDKEDLFVGETGILGLYIDNRSKVVYVAELEVGFFYKKEKEARKTFKKVLNSGLMLRSNHQSSRSPMIEIRSYQDNRRYETEDKGRSVLARLTRKRIDILSISGYYCSKYSLKD